MSAIFDAIDITTLTTDVSSVIIGFIAVGLLFLGFKYAKKVLAKG